MSKVVILDALGGAGGGYLTSPIGVWPSKAMFPYAHTFERLGFEVVLIDNQTAQSILAHKLDIQTADVIVTIHAHDFRSAGSEVSLEGQKNISSFVRAENPYATMILIPFQTKLAQWAHSDNKLLYDYSYYDGIISHHSPLTELYSIATDLPCVFLMPPLSLQSLEKEQLDINSGPAPNFDWSERYMLHSYGLFDKSILCSFLSSITALSTDVKLITIATPEVFSDYWLAQLEGKGIVCIPRLHHGEWVALIQQCKGVININRNYSLNRVVTKGIIAAKGAIGSSSAYQDLLYPDLICNIGEEARLPELVLYYEENRLEIIEKANYNLTSYYDLAPTVLARFLKELE